MKIPFVSAAIQTAAALLYSTACLVTASVYLHFEKEIDPILLVITLLIAVSLVARLLRTEKDLDSIKSSLTWEGVGIAFSAGLSVLLLPIMILVLLLIRHG